ncbi:GNAT family N-acetyltransferase [Vibrio artabrorum]|uniref:GNAT family N-acetyltransferase n=1 Tax=Vibrio artabrorum TaxID=446374 RepID=A0ABT8CKH5_9VIBR|nr:GNAT family N-acetyltransferase [Vibrio artabrorum]MDN3701958.1 GNAT family N-acetyltransferase [Vibrio artabrorum]
MESERLELVPPSLKYADAMYQVIDESRRELSQFLPWVSDEFWFNIIEKETGMFVGAIGFIVRDKSVPYFEIGYWLKTSKTGLGYVSEAIGLVEQFAFINKSAQRVEIKMAGSNLRSQLVAKRCGYKLEAHLANARRLPSGELDSTVVYAKMCL